jgi:hypothetical protein
VDLKETERGDLSQDTDQRQGLANTALKFIFHKMSEISWLAENLLDSQEGFCSSKLVISTMLNATLTEQSLIEIFKRVCYCLHEMCQRPRKLFSIITEGVKKEDIVCSNLSLQGRTLYIIIS